MKRFSFSFDQCGPGPPSSILDPGAGSPEAGMDTERTETLWKQTEWSKGTEVWDYVQVNSSTCLKSSENTPEIHNEKDGSLELTQVHPM